MRRDHFAIEQERNVGVEFLLKLVQPLIRAIPGPRLVHREKNLIGFLIVREEIDHGGIRHARVLAFCSVAIRCHSERSVAKSKNLSLCDSSTSLGMTRKVSCHREIALLRAAFFWKPSTSAIH